MKRIFLAPLLSAVVLPGLGQILNRQYRKAGVLIAAVSVLFMVLFIKVLFDLNKVLLTLPAETLEESPRLFSTVALTLSGRDKTWLLFLILLLLGIWVYGVWDAFWVARKSEKRKS
jgi:Na+(H+)/acetate symporter ActP